MGLLARHRRFWIVQFFVLLTLPMLMQAIQPRHATSVREARNLAPAPAVPRTLTELQAWPRVTEKFLGDHFGFRETLVRANALWRYAVISPTDLLALYGKGKFLFFDGDAMMAQSMGLVRRDSEIAKFADFAQRLREKTRARGAQFLVTIAPNSATIMRAQLPDWATGIRRPTEYDLMLAALAARGVPHLDLRPALFAANDRTQMYRRSDTHWNKLGALNAYNAVVAALQKPDWWIEPDRVFKGFEPTSGGDLSRMLGISADIGDRDARIDLSGYDPPKSRVTPIDTKRETGGDLVETGRAGPTVLVLGDSFTRYFWQDYFALHAGRYVWIHGELCGFVPEIADSYAADIVILAPTERFMFCWNI